MGWTTPATLVTGDVIQASWANTHVRDNERYLKGLDGAVAIEDDVNITGDVNTSAGANIGGTSGAVTGELKSLLGRFTGFPTPTGGSGVEIGVISNEGYVQAFDRTAAVHRLIYLIGSTIVFSIAGTEKGRVNSTGFSGDGSQLTALNATQLTSGTVPDARISGKNISIFTNNSGYLTPASSVAASQLTGQVLATSQSIANDGTYTVCPANAGGFFFLRDDQGNPAILYLYDGPLQNEFFDPFSVFTLVAGTASSWNLYTSGGNIIIQNKRGSTRTISIARIAGG